MTRRLLMALIGAMVAAAPFIARLTQAGDTRVTQAGEPRKTQGS